MVFIELPKLESIELIKFTRNVGRAKMFKLNSKSKTAELLEKFAFEVATRRIDKGIGNETVQNAVIICCQEIHQLSKPQHLIFCQPRILPVPPCMMEYIL